MSNQYIQLSVNRTRQLGLFETLGQGIGFEEAYQMALQSFKTQASRTRYQTISVGYSGGKDSTTVVTLLAHFIKTGQLDLDPHNVHILYGDTGRELPPLHDHAMLMLDVLRKEGFNTRVVKPPIDKTFWVQMLGRGLPVPWSLSRWCVSSLKTDEMERVVRGMFYKSGQAQLETELRKPDQRQWFSSHTKQGSHNRKVQMLNKYGQKLLMITGMRLGESNTRDQKIEHICTVNGECGTGMWEPKADEYDRLAPLVRWRTCHIFDWLKDWCGAYDLPSHGYPTQRVAEIYGDEDIRTGCAACSVATKDQALINISNRMPEYACLKPLLRLRDLWAILREERGLRLFNDGTAKSQTQDLGPITIEGRRLAYEFIQRIQHDIYALGGTYQIISMEERARIFWHWEHGTWPTGWDGTQPVGNAKQKLPNGMQEFEWFGE